MLLILKKFVLECIVGGRAEILRPIIEHLIHIVMIVRLLLRVGLVLLRDLRSDAVLVISLIR